jgi:hypothetical protein
MRLSSLSRFFSLNPQNLLNLQTENGYSVKLLHRSNIFQDAGFADERRFQTTAFIRVYLRPFVLTRRCSPIYRKAHPRSSEAASEHSQTTVSALPPASKTGDGLVQEQVLVGTGIRAQETTMGGVRIHPDTRR